VADKKANKLSSGVPKTVSSKNPAKKNKKPVGFKWYLDENRIQGWSSFVYSLPKEGKEHDGWSLRNNNAVVSDGATPLSEEWGVDLYYWVNTLSALFAENGKDSNKSLIEVWKESISFVNTIFPPLGYKRTMGTSQFRLNGKMIETLTVGDTKIIFETVEGKFVEVFDKRLTAWEQRADALIDEGLLTGSMAAWHNRMKVNQLDGYYVVSDEPEVGLQAIQYSVEASKIKSVIMCTDGFWRLFEGEYELMFKKVNSSNPEALQNLMMDVGTISDDLTFIRLDNLNYQP
jgi:hypothetical protein